MYTRYHAGYERCRVYPGVYRWCIYPGRQGIPWWVGSTPWYIPTIVHLLVYLLLHTLGIPLSTHPGYASPLHTLGIPSPPYTPWVHPSLPLHHWVHTSLPLHHWVYLLLPLGSTRRIVLLFFCSRVNNEAKSGPYSSCFIGKMRRRVVPVLLRSLGELEGS